MTNAPFLELWIYIRSKLVFSQHYISLIGTQKIGLEDRVRFIEHAKRP